RPLKLFLLHCRNGQICEAVGGNFTRMNIELANQSINMSLIVPIVAAIIASSLTSYLTLRIRKFELLQISKIAAFKDVSNALTKLKRHCLGKVAEIEGNELSPYSADDSSIFECRQNLALVLDQ